ncbi:MAG: sigma-70 family RNA polymerase sigma factor, partial [Gammaproteobacteria bacterium]|nr:sigma-70 family RNA polymerase sigma factor [Gammaproteobacteria bacterium]
AYVRILAVERTEEIRELERYVWRSALNIATDHGRARQRWNQMAKTIGAQEEPIAPSAEVVADARERWTLLTQAVSELPPREHQAFVLRIAQSLPFEEVGQAMHISSRMAKIYVARTLASLQRRLEGGDAPRSVMTRRRSRDVAAPGCGGSVILGRSARSGFRAIAKGEPEVAQTREQRTQPRSPCPP